MGWDRFPVFKRLVVGKLPVTELGVDWILDMEVWIICVVEEALNIQKLGLDLMFDSDSAVPFQSKETVSIAGYNKASGQCRLCVQHRPADVQAWILNRIDSGKREEFEVIVRVFEGYGLAHLPRWELWNNKRQLQDQIHVYGSCRDRI
jgi:hypothetical protein